MRAQPAIRLIGLNNCYALLMSKIPKNEEFKRLLISWPDRAIQLLFNTYRENLIRFSEKRTRNLPDAEDVVQETFEYIWSKRETLGNSEGVLIAPYLYALVKKKSITYYNESLKRNEESLVEEPSIDYNQEVEMISVEEMETLRHILTKLTPRQQQCIVMRYFQEMTYAEIAKELNLTTKAIEANLTSARKKLKGFKSAFF